MDILGPFVYAAGTLRIVSGDLRPRRWRNDAPGLSTNHHRLVLALTDRIQVRLESGEDGSAGPGEALLLQGGMRGAIIAASGGFRHALFDLVPSPRRRRPEGHSVEADMTVQPPIMQVLGFPLPLVLRGAAAAVTRTAFARWSMISGHGIRDELARTGVLCELLAQLMPTAEERPGDDLLRIARGRPPGQWTVDELARAAGCSVRTLERRLRGTAYGSPRGLLARLLDEQIRAHLVAGFALSTIAQRTGMPSAAAVAAAFRRTNGCSPRAWLAAYRARRS